MKSVKMAESVQSEYLLEYGRQKMRGCAETFQSLAQILGEERTREEAVHTDLGEVRTETMVNSRLAEGRRVFAGNFREMAKMITDAAEETVRFICLGKKKQKQLIRELAGEGILAKDLYLIQHRDGQIELSVMLSVKNGMSKTVDTAADYLSVLTDMRLLSVKRNSFFIGREPEQFFFREEPDYLFMTGTARAVKEDEKVSGDSFAFFEAGDGNLTAVLSDGMGSGEEACADSEMIADMTEALLETGIEPRLAAGFINSAVMNAERGDRLPTLDLCSLNLYAGRCCFLKMGAAASFIKRGKAVETIASGSLPLGAFGKVQPECAHREISDGDIIVMVSDGITEGFRENDGEEKIRRYLSEMDAVSPTETANRLLRYSISECGGRIRDDMTVLVIGIWERRED